MFKSKSQPKKASSSAKQEKKRSSTVTRKRPGTKLEAVISLLSREAGATIKDLTKATDWQPHTVRSVLSRTIKQRGFNLVSGKPKDGGSRIYRITKAKARSHN